MRKKKKQAMTLLEIMIVIFIIGIIGSVVGYNMKGSLDRGKAFKTEQGMRQLYEVLNMELSNGHATVEEIKQNLEVVVKNTGFFRKPHEIIQDGWGNQYKIITHGDEVRFISEKYKKYCGEKKTTPSYPWDN